MNEFDSDEVVPSPRRRKTESRTTDTMLATLGVMLAAFAAFFPWYVFVNPQYFKITGTSKGMVRDLPELPFRNVVSVSPMASKDNDSNSVPPESIDQVRTASTPDTTESIKSKRETGDALSQPFPAAESSFRLVHVANGKALIQDQRGMFVVGVGDVLPDNSRLSTLTQRDGVWAIITSKGDTITE